MVIWYISGLPIVFCFNVHVAMDVLRLRFLGKLCAVLQSIESLICLHLENIFDWNVKQLFLYLSAEYSTKNNVSI